MKKYIFLISLMFVSTNINSMYNKNNRQSVSSKSSEHSIDQELLNASSMIAQHMFNLFGLKEQKNNSPNEIFNSKTTLSTEDREKWINEITNMQSNGEDFNSPRDNEGHTILMLASRDADCFVLKRILNVKDSQGNQCCDINLKDKHGRTALLFAINSKDKDKVSLLLDNKASLKLIKNKLSANVQNHLITELNQRFGDAIKANDVQKAKSLLEQADINVNELHSKEPGLTSLQRTMGITPLIFATSSNNIEMVNLLLTQPKININAASLTNETALFFASSLNRYKIVDLLLHQDNIDINHQNQIQNTSLIQATHFGHENIVKLLLDCPYIHVNKQNLEGTTALISATQQGSINIVKQLLNQKNTNVDIVDDEGCTALTKAVINNREDLLKLLLDHKANVNIPYLNSTILIYSILNCSKNVIELLLNQPNIDIDYKDSTGRTALDYAKQQRRWNIVKLIQAKLRNKFHDNKEVLKDISNKLEITNEQQSFESQEEKINRLNTEKLNNLFEKAISNGNIQEIEILLDKRNDKGELFINLNTLNKSGHNALMVVAQNGNLEAVRLLIPYMRNLINDKDSNGNTVLNLVTQQEHTDIFDIVEELVHQGANINTCNHENTTPLMNAIKHGHIRTVKLLLKKRAKTSLKNKYNQTALDIAKSTLQTLQSNSKTKKSKKSNNKIKKLELYKSIIKALVKTNHSEQVDMPISFDMNNITNYNWEINTTSNFDKEIDQLEKNDPVNYKKVNDIIRLMKIDPFRGIGKVERLQGDLHKYYSVQVNDKDRIVYDVDGELVTIQSCKNHYKKQKRR